MRVNRRNNCSIKQIGGAYIDASIVAERGIHWHGTRCSVAHQSVKPGFRHEIEQRRSCNKLYFAGQRVFELMIEIECTCREHDIWRNWRAGRVVQQSLIIIDKKPALLRLQPRYQRPQRRTRSAGQIYDIDCVLADERCDDGVEDRRITRAQVVRLAKSQPTRCEATHSVDSMAAAKISAESCQRGSVCAAVRAAAAMVRRSSPFSINRRRTVANAAASSRATSTPVPTGIVSGSAPAAVPTTGSPCAIASEKAIP